MKVLGFNGSPRRGFNTEKLVQTVLEGAEQKGAETTMFNLASMNISACKGCLACRKEGICSIKDDMEEIIREIKSADAVAIGSPVYMLQMTAQTKAFVDRLFPLIRSDFTSVLKEGTRVAWLFTQGAEAAEAFRTYFDYNETMFKYFGFTVETTLVAANTGSRGDLTQQKAKIQEALELGGKLTGNQVRFNL